MRMHAGRAKGLHVGVGMVMLVVGLFVAMQRASGAGDWPQWRYDAGHRAASPHDLPDTVRLQWEYKADPRVPVWEDPLNRDMMPYDRIFEPVIADGRVFLPFNDSDKVLALDVVTGEELWRYYADGPVRFAPVAHDGNVYFTSDDGYLYCVGAAEGDLRWRFRGGPSSRRVLGNGRLISTWPARGGPVVSDRTVYFAASIWPFMGTFIYALDAETGEVVWLNDRTSADFQKQPHAAPAFAGIAPQGQFAVAGDLLLVPGGRSLPAGFDLATGRQQFFDFGGKGEGGSFVAASDNGAFVHTRRRGTLQLSLPDGGKTDFRVNEPVIDRDLLYTAAMRDDQTPVIRAIGPGREVLWEVAADASGDLIRAGGRLYAAGGGRLTAIDLPEDDREAHVAWTMPCATDVVRLVAGADRLVTVGLDGTVAAYGAEMATSRHPGRESRALDMAPEVLARAKRIASEWDLDGGYALWLGIDDTEFLTAMAVESDVKIVAVDSDRAKIDRLRRSLDDAGLYGRRIATVCADPMTFDAPPYVGSLVVVSASLMTEESLASLDALAETVRPYGGRLWIPASREDALTMTARLNLPTWPHLGRSISADGLVLTREGALPGAADWTHAYGDIANTVKSNDRRVRLPLGLLWFGGSSNMDVLPRHGHGPSEQVIGGRLFIQGMDSLQARDVYTGRVLWKREFADLGTFDVYYDDTYENTPLSTAYNQVHIPGANARGTNYVATAEGVYLAMEDRCVLVDPATGQTKTELRLRPSEDGSEKQWAFIGVYGDLLLAGDGFADYSEQYGYRFTPEKKRGPAWAPDRSASEAIIAFDRRTGAPVWRITSRYGFLHNGIVAGGGRVYLLDKLPRRVEAYRQRRGATDPLHYRIVAVDAQTGRKAWVHEDETFGTWLSYSAEHDLLVQAGAAATDRSMDEVDQGIAVLEGDTGDLVWSRRDMKYAGPCMLHGDHLITNTNSYAVSQGALRLADGEPVRIPDPVTGEPTVWRFTRTYGCNTAVASEHLLTFRSGAAGFYDLTTHSGTGNFGGFKSGCTSNLIVANGVLNAPDYTRTCTCGYQNQTSLALVPMPENEMWTYSVFGEEDAADAPMRRIGINLGAPGDRRSHDGTLWVNYPPDSGKSPSVDIEVTGDLSWFRHHSSRVDGPAPRWVAASGAVGIERLAVRLRDRTEPAAEPTGAAEETVALRLIFAEPTDDAQAGQRRFDVVIGEQTVVTELDIGQRSGERCRYGTSLECEATTVDGLVVIRLVPRGPLPPVLCGVEIQSR